MPTAFFRSRIVAACAHKVVMLTPARLESFGQVADRVGDVEAAAGEDEP